MTAIAQTLDGTETFETKKELFDYVFSSLFEQEWFLVIGEGESFLKIATEILFVSKVNIISTIELSGIDITNSEIVEKLNFTKAIPKIIAERPNGHIYIYEDNAILYVNVNAEDNGPLGTKGREYMDLKIAPEYINVLSER